MACFGKALGNGVPISAIVGTAEVMDIFDEVFFSFTFGGDMLGIAAAHAVLNVLEREPVLERTGEIGTALLSGVRALIDRHRLKDRIGIEGYPQKTFMSFSGDGEDGLLIKSIYQQEAIARGVLAAGYHAPCLAHTQEDVEKTLAAYDHAFSVIARGLKDGNLEKTLRGRPVQPVFRKH
jgi:glutamate-1-semialdehyde 2,1-aminomutase/spore coat polysaccharide biosynthesis protein SpsF